MSIADAVEGEPETSVDRGRAAFSVPEVAEKLGVCDASVWRALKRGDLKAIKFGGRTLVTANSMNKLLSAA